MTTDTYNFPDHIKGDTIEMIEFTVTVNSSPLNLENATIIMDLRSESGKLLKRFETGDGLTITDNDGVFEFDEQIIDVMAGDHKHDIEFQLDDGRIKTYIKGNWTITQDQTRD